MNLQPADDARLDLSGFDRPFAEKVFRRVGGVLRAVFGLRVDGLDNLDLSRPGVLVTNHNLGGWGAFELFGPGYAWYALQKDPPDVIGQGGAVLFKAPFGVPFARRMGIVLASLEGMRGPLLQGRWVMTSPGALVDQFRPLRRRNRPRLMKCSWIGGRRVLTDQLGYVSVATETGAPIYPVAISGSWGMTPVLFESTRVARWTGLATRFRQDEQWPSFPVTLNHLVNLSVFALTPLAAYPLAWALFILANVYLDWVYTYPLFPFRLRIRFGPPVETSGPVPPTAGERLDAYREVHARVVGRLGAMLRDLDEERLWKRAWRQLAPARRPAR